MKHNLKIGNYYNPNTRTITHTVYSIEPEEDGFLVNFFDHNQGSADMGMMLKTYKKYFIDEAGFIHEDKLINKLKNNNMNGFSRAVVSPTEEMNGFSRMDYIIDGYTLNDYELNGYELNGRTMRKIKRFYKRNAPWSYVGTIALGLLAVDIATGGKVRESLGMKKKRRR